jgi:excisionase family DNA binding protein
MKMSDTETIESGPLPKENSTALVARLPIQPIAVTIEQAARLIGTNDKQIRRAIYARELPAVRLGKSYSIAIADLTKWFERKKKFL